MKTSSIGINFIKAYEGLSLEPYLCPAKVPTIGYGHTKGVKITDPAITEEEATALLKEDIADAEMIINRLHINLTQGQIDALVSFVYNLGEGNFKSSTLLKKLLAGDYLEAALEFPKWSKAGGKRSKGLIRRRLNESLMFLS